MPYLVLSDQSLDVIAITWQTIIVHNAWIDRHETGIIMVGYHPCVSIYTLSLPDIIGRDQISQAFPKNALKSALFL